jgi:hypothetical protein
VLGLFWDIGQVLLENFYWLPFNPPPLCPPYPVLQLVSELAWSLVDSNRLCDPKATWRKVLLSIWFLMMRILVTGKTELTTMFRARIVQDAYVIPAMLDNATQ